MGNNACTRWLDSPESLTDDQLAALDALHAVRDRDADHEAMFSDPNWLAAQERRLAMEAGEAA